MTYNTADSPQTLHAWNAGVYGADIIGFQELAKVIWRKHYQEHIAAADNKGIHSRYPRVGTETRIIYQDTANEDIAGLRAVYRIEGREVSVYSVHPRRPALGLRPLGYFNQDRERAIRHLVDQVAQDTNPVIVLCDCNFSDRTDAYASLSTHLQDAWAARGFGLGLTPPAYVDRGGLPFTLGRPDLAIT